MVIGSYEHRRARSGSSTCGCFKLQKAMIRLGLARRAYLNSKQEDEGSLGQQLGIESDLVPLAVERSLL